MIMSPSSGAELHVLQLIIEILATASGGINAHDTDGLPIRSTTCKVECHQLTILAKFHTCESYLDAPNSLAYAQMSIAYMSKCR